MYNTYNPLDNYWSRPGELYSSARNMVVPSGDTEYAAWCAAGGVPTPWPDDLSDVLRPYGIVYPSVSVQDVIIDATQTRLDTFARTRGYDSILSASTYATSAIPRFATEGQYAVNARDQTWAALYTLMDEVQAGMRPMPTGFADVEALLPLLEWPV